MSTKSDNSIVAFVKKVRAAAVRRLFVGVSLVFILVASAAFLAAYAVENSRDLSPGFVDSVRGVAIVFIALTIVWAAGGIIRARRARFVGARLRPSYGAFAGQLRSALELASPKRPQDLEGFSAPLIDAHVRAVEIEAEAVNVERLFPAPRYRLWAIVLIPTIAACFFIAGLGPKNAAHAWLRLLGLASPTEVADRVVVADRTLVHDLTLRLKYPDYMSRAPRLIDGSTGDIQAPIGTVVDISVRTIAALSPHGRLVFERDREESTFARNHDGRLTVSFVVRQAGAYRIGLRKAGSPDVTWDPTERQIRIDPDRDPTISIVQPGPHLEVSPKQKVDVTFRAADDFGLRSIDLEVWEVGAQPTRTRTRSFALPPRDAEGTIALDVALYRPRAGVPLHYRFIATDNNTLTPGTGSSPTHTLLVVSPREKHRRLLDRARRAWESLVQILGDRIEHSLPIAIDADLLAKIRGTNTKTAALGKELDLLAKAFAELPPQKSDRNKGVRIETTLAQVAGHLISQATKWLEPTERRERRMLLDLRAATIPVLENDVLRLDDHLRAETLDDAIDIAETLLARQAELRSLLKRYQETRDPALREELRREISRLRAEFKELVARLAELSERAPAEHLNTDAVDSKDLLGALERASDKIDSGDFESALKELDDLKKDLDDFLKQMKDGRAKHTEGAFGEDDRELSKFMDALHDLESAEREILDETRSLDRAARERAEAQNRSKNKAAIDRAKKKIETAENELRDVEANNFFRSDREQLERAKTRLKEARDRLEENDISDAAEMAEHGAEAMQSLKDALGFRRLLREQNAATSERVARALETTREAIEGLKKMMEGDSAGEGATPDERAKRKRLGERQGEVRKRMSALRERMGKEGGKAPFMTPKVSGKLGEAESNMEGAEKKLAQGRLGAAERHERAAAESLRQAKEAAKGRGREGEKKGDEKEGGREGASRERVEIPDANRHQVPKEFRKELLDAMREALPERSRETVKKYFEEIVK